MTDKVVTATRTVNRPGRRDVPPCYTAEMLKKLVATIVIVASAAVPTACGRAPSDDPDLLLTGGVIYPLGSTDDAVEAVALRGNEILAMGTDSEILQLAGPYTQQMPLEDSVVFPGVYDAWVDLEALGRWSAAGLDLRRASSIDEVRAMVRNAADAPTSVDGWIVGWGWDENDWPEAELPDHTDLDAAGLAGPVALLHRSGLMAWVNSAALAALTGPLASEDSPRRGPPRPYRDSLGERPRRARRNPRRRRRPACIVAGRRCAPGCGGRHHARRDVAARRIGDRAPFGARVSWPPAAPSRHSPATGGCREVRSKRVATATERQRAAARGRCGCAARRPAGLAARRPRGAVRRRFQRPFPC